MREAFSVTDTLCTKETTELLIKHMVKECPF